MGYFSILKISGEDFLIYDHRLKTPLFRLANRASFSTDDLKAIKDAIEIALTQPEQSKQSEQPKEDTAPKILAPERIDFSKLNGSERITDIAANIFTDFSSRPIENLLSRLNPDLTLEALIDNCLTEKTEEAPTRKTSEDFAMLKRALVATGCKAHHAIVETFAPVMHDYLERHKDESPYSLLDYAELNAKLPIGVENSHEHPTRRTLFDVSNCGEIAEHGIYFEDHYSPSKTWRINLYTHARTSQKRTILICLAFLKAIIKENKNKEATC